MYDGDYLTKPGNANALVSEDDGIGEGGTTGGGTTGGGGRSSLNQHQRSSSKPGVVSRMTRASKHEASEHTDMNDSNYEKVIHNTLNAQIIFRFTNWGAYARLCGLRILRIGLIIFRENMPCIFSIPSPSMTNLINVIRYIINIFQNYTKLCNYFQQPLQK